MPHSPHSAPHPVAWAAPLWATTAGVLLLATIFIHYATLNTGSAGLAALVPTLHAPTGLNDTLSLLNQILITFVLSAVALVFIVAAVYRLNPPVTPNPSAATPPEPGLKAAYQSRTPAPLRGYRPVETPRTSFRPLFTARATPDAGFTPPPPQPETFTHAYNEAPKRPLPPASTGPQLPLARQAEILLQQANTIANFSTTPLPGQRRVLAKLAENYVPAPQRAAALSLALFRLRSPTRAA